MVDEYLSKNPLRFENIDEPFKIVDYGCVHGGTTILPAKWIIQKVRDKTS